MKKLLMLLLSVIMAFGATFSAVGCGGEQLRDDISYFNIIAPNNGNGIRGILALAQKFQDANTETSFAEGKKGVIVSVEQYPGVVPVTNIRTEGYHVYINPYSVDNSMISGGDFLNVDEIVKETIPGEERSLHDKIPENYRSTLQGASKAHGEGYYFTPALAYMGGLTYDKHLFDEKGYYFVAPGQEDEAQYFPSDITGKEVYFAMVSSELYEEAITAEDDWTGWNSSQYLSSGPDGEFGTHDDGMPSTLEEMVILCEYMKSDSTAPFVLSGKYPDNHGYTTDGMINALLGTKDNMLAMKSMQTEGASFEIVTGYTGESLWGLSDATVPKTAKVQITEQQGYYTTWSTARYYTTAFWRLAVNKKWFSKTVSGDTSHIDAQADFIFNGYDNNRERSAFMIEASYWFNESVERNNFEDFDKMNYEVDALEREKQIKWYSIPRVINGTVADGTFTDAQGTPESFMFISAGGISLYNAVYADDPEALEMIRQWILFLYSDENQTYWSVSTGSDSILDLGDSFNPEAFNDRPFYKDLFTRMEKGDVIKPTHSCKTAKDYPDLFLLHGWDTCWTDLATSGKCDLYTAFTKGQYGGVKACFEAKLIEYGTWGGIYKPEGYGDDNAPPPTYATDENGKKIEFKR